MGGAGADIFYLEPERKKNIWSRSRGRMAQLRNTGNKNEGKDGMSTIQGTSVYNYLSAVTLNTQGCRILSNAYSKY